MNTQMMIYLAIGLGLGYFMFADPKCTCKDAPKK